MHTSYHYTHYHYLVKGLHAHYHYTHYHYLVKGLHAHYHYLVKGLHAHYQRDFIHTIILVKALGPRDLHTIILVKGLAHYGIFFMLTLAVATGKCPITFGKGTAHELSYIW